MEGDLQVKTVTVAHPHEAMKGRVGVLALKGISDDNDYLTLGDYGKKFGDGESGVVMRAMYRQIYHYSKTLRAKARSIIALHAAHIHRIRVNMKFRPSAAKPQAIVKTDQGKEKLITALAFGLAIHRDRMKVVVTKDADLAVDIFPPKKSTYALEDLQFDPRVWWKTASEYYGEYTVTTPLSVVALTVVEKAKMDDSDIWGNEITKFLIPEETNVDLVLASGDCKALRAPHIKCEVQAPVEGAESVPVGHDMSVLHMIHAPGANDELYSSPFTIVDTGRGKPWLWPHVMPSATLANIKPSEEDDDP